MQQHWQEHMILAALRKKRGMWVKQWALINEVALQYDKALQYEMFVALERVLYDMIKSKQVIRFHKRDGSGGVRISELYA